MLRTKLLPLAFSLAFAIADFNPVLAFPLHHKSSARPPPHPPPISILCGSANEAEWVVGIVGLPGTAEWVSVAVDMAIIAGSA